MELVRKGILETLPRRVYAELERLADGCVGGVGAVSEVRLLLGCGSSVRIHGRRHRLSARVSAAEMEATFTALCGGAVYAHRDTITDGYICAAGGVRVGVCGQARYECDRLVGVSDVSALIYRLPTARSSLAEELYVAYARCERGMLIYSRAGVGKTTALRTLLPMIAEREPWCAVVAVDERCELSEERGVTVLRGYKRAAGMDLALRTLGADVIAVDEIGGAAEARLMRESLRSGVKFIATAHAECLGDVLARDGTAPLIELGAFDVFFGIRYTEGTYSAVVEKIECIKS